MISDHHFRALAICLTFCIGVAAGLPLGCWLYSKLHRCPEDE